MTANKLNHKQAQWSLCLVRFSFLLHYCPDKSMGKPDALSQWPNHRDGSQDNMDIVLLKPKLLAVYALVGIAFEGKKQALLTNIWQGNKLGCHKKSVAKAVRELYQSSTKSMRSSEWSEEDDILIFQSKIYVPGICDLHWHIVSLYHNTRVARYTGCWKTLELVSQRYWQPQISRYISQYIGIYDLCL